MNIIVGCEESQAVTIELRKLGHNAFSCDLLECSGGHPEWHIQDDIFNVINGGAFTVAKGYSFQDEVIVYQWDLGIFFPTCTYLTCSAEWAYKEGPYHQKVKPGTLTGKERLQARADAYEFFMALYNCKIPKVAIENPVGIMSSYFRKPDQIVQPWQFGDNASKSTCIWLKGLPKLKCTEIYPPRMINGKKRWSNQTDSGQNNLTPSDDRAKKKIQNLSRYCASYGKPMVKY